MSRPFAFNKSSTCFLLPSRAAWYSAIKSGAGGIGGIAGLPARESWQMIENVDYVVFVKCTRIAAYNSASLCNLTEIAEYC